MIVAQHDFDVIAHVQGFARGIRQGERGRFKRALVKVARPRRIGFLDPIWKKILQQRRHAVEQAHEDDRHRHIECYVKLGREFRKVGLPSLQYLGDWTQEWCD